MQGVQLLLVRDEVRQRHVGLLLLVLMMLMLLLLLLLLCL